MDNNDLIDIVNRMGTVTAEDMCAALKDAHPNLKERALRVAATLHAAAAQRPAVAEQKMSLVEKCRQVQKYAQLEVEAWCEGLYHRANKIELFVEAAKEAAARFKEGSE